MKKITLILVAMVFASATFAQNMAIDKFFEKYEGQKGFTSVNVSEKLFNMVASAVGEEDIEAKEMISNLKSIKVLTYENAENELKSKEYFKEIEATLPKSNYDELLNVNADGEKVLLLGKMQSDNVISELLILVNDDEEFVMVDIFGLIDLSKISKLSEMDIDGLKLDQLKKLDDEKESTK